MDMKEFTSITHLDTFSDDKVHKSFYFVCEQLAKEYYDTEDISEEKVLKFMINLLWHAGYDANDDKFMGWYANMYEQYIDVLENRADELDEDDDYFTVYCD